MSKQTLAQTKSLMYKIISLGCGVYLDDWDDFVVSALVCYECGRPWNNSRTECFFCGTNNFHVYKCLSCGKYLSLTNATGKCDNCGGELSKVCINPDCITNNPNYRLSTFVNAKGGVFEKTKSASMLNEMRCKVCGCKSSVYKTRRFKIVDGFENCNDSETIYIKYNGVNDYLVKYGQKIEHFTIMEEVLQDIMNVNCELD